MRFLKTNLHLWSKQIRMASACQVCFQQFLLQSNLLAHNDMPFFFFFAWETDLSDMPSRTLQSFENLIISGSQIYT